MYFAVRIDKSFNIEHLQEIRVASVKKMNSLIVKKKCLQFIIDEDDIG